MFFLFFNEVAIKCLVIIRLIFLPSVSRLQESLRRVDAEGVYMRRLRLHVLRRRQYSVPGPNSLWHIDGNHKLIRSVILAD